MSARAKAAIRPTLAEELVHSVTHGIGAVFAIGALVTLVVGAALHGSTTHIAAASVFGVTLVLLYVSSTIYHSIPATLPRAKSVFQIFDHAAIHLLIAGTYTPFTLVAIGGTFGWSLFGIIWALAALGVVVEVTPLRRFERFSLALYLVMGWLCVPALPTLWHALPTGALVLLAAGGIAYTAGVPFYIAKRRWMHAWWHVFVLAGSALHVAAIALFVLR